MWTMGNDRKGTEKPMTWALVIKFECVAGPLVQNFTRLSNTWSKLSGDIKLAVN